MNGKNSSNVSATDWQRLAAIKDADIDTSDIPEADEDFFERAKLNFGGRPVTPEEMVTLCLEPELAAWVRSMATAHSQKFEAALKRLREEMPLADRGL
jgi:hypothetical protein